MSARVISILVAAGVAAVVVAAFATLVARPSERSFAKHFEAGVYVCATCRQPLFRSDDKFESTTRWPAFRVAIADAVATRPDGSFGLERTEVLCGQCNAHLGHVFEDGALAGDTHPEASLRYCILSSALDFEARAEP